MSQQHGPGVIELKVRERLREVRAGELAKKANRDRIGAMRPLWMAAIPPGPRRSALFSLVAGACISTAAGQTNTSPEQVREWFERTWCSGQDCIPAGDGHLKIRVEFPAEASPREVERVWEQYKNRVDHPRRAWAEKQRERLAHGPQVTLSEFWRSEARWRYNETHFEPDGDVFLYVDRVWTPEINWSMTPRDLHLADPKRPPSDKAPYFRKPQIATELLITACRSLFHADAGAPNAGDEPEIVSIEPHEENWLVAVAKRGLYQWV